MRIVARLAITIATLIGASVECWGQIPRVAAGVATVPNAASHDRAAPRLSPPRSAEGTWVSDDQPSAAGQEMFDAQELTGMEGYAASPYEPSPYAQGAVADDGCADGPCDDSGGPGTCALGRHGLGHGKCRPMDLWDEVHAHRRMWVQADYLSFWIKGNNLPPLVTTSPLGTPQAQAGVLPVSADTSILFGNERVDRDQRNGGRISFGYWLIDGEFLGIEGQYFALQQQNTLFSASSDFSGGDPNAIILARPFINVDPVLPTPTEDSSLIAFPDFQLGNVNAPLDGSINIRTTSNVQSANATLRRLIWIDFTMQRRLDLLLGYRFFRLDDSVTINDSSTFEGGLLPRTTFTVQDQFSTINQFHGGEIGLKGQCYHGRFSLEGVVKCAFGSNHQGTYINGFNTTTVDDVTTTGVGGLLALPTNIGLHGRNVFAILPEADGNLRIDLTRNLRMTIGYTFLYMNRVQRSGDAIDRTVNPTQIGGPLVGEARPAFFATDSTFWAHGANAGIEYRW